MTKKVFLLLIAMAVLLAACVKKEEKVAPKPEQKEKPMVVFINSPIPSFESVFKRLATLKTAEYDKIIPANFAKDQTDPAKAAFELGKITADAIFVTKSRNKSKLLDIAKKMLDYSKLIGINEAVLKLSDELQELIKNEKWDGLEEVLEKYKKQVELSLFETDRDMYTLLKIGGWIEGLNRFSQLILDDFDQRKTSLINEKGILNGIISNFEMAKNPIISEADFYKPVIENLKKIKEVIYAEKKGEHSSDQLKQILEYTEEIKARF